MLKSIPVYLKKVQLPLALSGIAIGTILLTSSSSFASVLRITDTNLERLDLQKAGWQPVTPNTNYLPWDNCGVDKYCGKDLDAPYKQRFAKNLTRMADYKGYYWGQCVSFVKALSQNTENTNSWRKGQNVAEAIKQGTIPVGTAIATFFGRRGTYAGHTAFYAGADISPEGKINYIWVYDQNWRLNRVLYHKNITSTGSGPGNLNNYFIVEVP